MADSIEVKILADDLVHESDLLAEHGLCFWISKENRQVLFDTGQGLVLEHNAEKLDINLSRLSAAVVSHGHNDHGGGIEELLEHQQGLSLYGHPEIFSDKYVKEDKGNLRNAGIDFSREQVNFKPIEDHQEICGGLQLTGPIPRKNDWETTPDNYLKLIEKEEEEELVKDDFIDDQALFFPTSSGTVVLLGCAHAGAVNTLEHIRSISSQSSLRAVLGGMHLYSADDHIIKKTIEYLDGLDLDLIVPMHCTGFSAQADMMRSLNTRVKIGKVGERYTF